MKKQTRSHSRSVSKRDLLLLLLALLALAAGLAVPNPGFGQTVGAPPATGATRAPADAPVMAYLPRERIGEVGRGRLLFDTGAPEGLLIAPTVITDVDIDVSGLVARARVRQTFLNPGDGWVEGIYVFPLPETAAVDHLRVRIGDRVIEGLIKERGEAKRIYDAAKQEGRKAGLLESERPNIFTTSIANIGPGENVAIEIEYQQVLRFDQGRFRLRFPMVVGPRYIPGPVRTVSFDDGGWSVGTGRVPDAGRITPPVLPPELGKINPLRLGVNLDAGFALADIESPYHAIDVAELDGGRYAVSLAGGAVPADRDFELVWRPETGAAPAAGLFTESLDDADYLLVMVMPPSVQPADERRVRLPREVIFVVDTSGSMAGASIVQAKAALMLAIDRLAGGDRFNVIQFNSTTSALFPAPRAVDAQTRARARRYVQGLSADGGTEMAPALRLALAGDAPGGFIRQVMFLTDGSVGNEAELFAIIDGELGASRLFTIGIGSAPNGFFMRKAAETGRGTFTYIGEVDEVAERMSELFEKIEQPVLTDLAISWPEEVAAEVSTDTLADLYAGEPVVFTARLPRTQGTAKLTGRLADRLWTIEIPLSSGGDASGVAKLWAGERIDDLMDQLYRRGDDGSLRSQVVALGLRHHLVTRYTSLVAVDATPTRPGDQPLDSRKLPLNLPQGWDYGKVFGEGAQPFELQQRDASLMPITPSPAKSSSIAASFTAPTVMAATEQLQIGTPAGLSLPRGATLAPLHAVAGLVLVLLGLLVLAVRWRAA